MHNLTGNQTILNIKSSTWTELLNTKLLNNEIKFDVK